MSKENALDNKRLLKKKSSIENVVTHALCKCVCKYLSQTQSSLINLVLLASLLRGFSSPPCKARIRGNLPCLPGIYVCSGALSHSPHVWYALWSLSHVYHIFLIQSRTLGLILYLDYCGWIMLQWNGTRDKVLSLFITIVSPDFPLKRSAGKY